LGWITLAKEQAWRAPTEKPWATAIGGYPRIGTHLDSVVQAHPKLGMVIPGRPGASCARTSRHAGLHDRLLPSAIHHLQASSPNWGLSSLTKARISRRPYRCDSHATQSVMTAMRALPLCHRVRLASSFSIAPCFPRSSGDLCHPKLGCDLQDS